MSYVADGPWKVSEVEIREIAWNHLGAYGSKIDGNKLSIIDLGNAVAYANYNGSRFLQKFIYAIFGSSLS